ncbi:MAG TPA: hypothetical protein VIH57_14110 [Bacteroidales bacterium]
MGERLILTNEDVLQFERALQMLDLSINEFREVADSMAPEKLVTKGLHTYFTEYCKALEQERNLKINLSFTSEFQHLEESHEMSVFRVLRAVLAYIVKYSGASEISISLSRDNFNLSMQIAINCNGFDLSRTTIPGAKEIAYIKLWVEIQKGKFMILPHHNKGNEVIIELNLKN